MYGMGDDIREYQEDVKRATALNKDYEAALKEIIKVGIEENTDAENCVKRMLKAALEGLNLA